MNYTLLQWLLMFYVYAFLGWIWECCYVSIKDKGIVNRGFLYGPMIPIYGFGAITILLLTLPFEESIAHIYVLGALGASALEYVTGALMEKIFKVRYWDYSHHKYNLKGHISLFVSLAWGVFSVLLVKVLHQPIENVILQMPYHIAEPLGLVLTVAFVSDATISIQSALDLKKLLKQAADNNKLLASLSLKLNNITSSVSETSQELHKQITSIATDMQEHIHNLKSKGKTDKGFPMHKLQKQKNTKLHLLDQLNNKLDIVIKEIQKQRNVTSPSKKKIELSNIIKDLDEIKSQIRKIELNISSLNDKVYKRVMSLVRRNPTSVSRDFEKTLQEIKSFIGSKNGRKKK